MRAAHVRRGGRRLPHWDWLPAMVTLGLLLWALASVGERNSQTVTTPQERVAGERQYLRDDMLPLTVALRDPEAHWDRTVSGTASVAGVVSGRAFWLAANGDRLFTVLNEPVTTLGTLRPGQQVRVTGRILDARQAVRMPGSAALESEVAQIMAQESAFLLVDTEEVEVVREPSGSIQERVP